MSQESNGHLWITASVLRARMGQLTLAKTATRSQESNLSARSPQRRATMRVWCGAAISGDCVVESEKISLGLRGRRRPYASRLAFSRLLWYTRTFR